MRWWWLAVGLAGCGGASDEVPVDDTDPVSALTLEDLLVEGPFGVGSLTLDLVDTTRGTAAHGGQPALDERTLPVWIWYPAAAGTGSASQAVADAPASTAGPFPLVVHSHGFMSDNSHHAGLGRFLASHGYVFVAPRFPLTNLTTPGGADVRDVVNQPGDVSFVIDRMLASDGPLPGVADPDAVALSGLSLGGFTTLLAGLAPDYRDERVDLLITMAGATCFVPTSAFEAPGPPMLILHGDADAIVPYDDNALPLYEAANGPVHLVTLAGGTHTGFPDFSAALFDGLDNADSVGCDAIDGTLPDSGEITDDPVFGGLGPFLGDDCASPCGEPLGTGMRPTRQVELTQATVRAFLEAGFRQDAELGLYLDRGIGLQEDDVTVSFRAP